MTLLHIQMQIFQLAFSVLNKNLKATLRYINNFVLTIT